MGLLQMGFDASDMLTKFLCIPDFVVRGFGTSLPEGGKNMESNSVDCHNVCESRPSPLSKRFCCTLRSVLFSIFNSRRIMRQAERIDSCSLVNVNSFYACAAWT